VAAQRFLAINADDRVILVFGAAFCAVNHFVHQFGFEPANRKAVTLQKSIGELSIKDVSSKLFTYVIRSIFEVSTTRNRFQNGQQVKVENWES
jgi:hypothetical protein